MNLNHDIEEKDRIRDLVAKALWSLGEGPITEQHIDKLVALFDSQIRVFSETVYIKALAHKDIEMWKVSRILNEALEELSKEDVDE